MKTMLVLCDVDGTVANHEHRVHHVTTRPRNFVAFNAMMMDDTPIAPIVAVVNALHVTGHTVFFASGREGTERHRQITGEWLAEHVGPWTHDVPLFMRDAGDYRPDNEVKEDILDHKVIPHFGRIPDLAFDDRNRVVEMWRRRGIRVAQVAEGNF